MKTESETTQSRLSLLALSGRGQWRARTQTFLIGALCFALCAGAASAATNRSVYTFDNLNDGNIAGQDNWTKRDIGAFGGVTLKVTPVANLPGTAKALASSNGGGNKNSEASRLNDANFAIPQFTGFETAAFLEASLERGYWGHGFAVGYDSDKNGSISLKDPGDIGVYVEQSYANRRVSVRMANGTTYSTTSFFPTYADVPDWSRYRLVMDVTANGGAGIASLYWRNATSDPPVFVAVTGLTNLPMGLSPLADDARNPTNWNGILADFESDSGFVADLVVGLGETPQELTVEPPSGLQSGGFTVTITGDALGDGTDITNVTLAGVSATIVDQTETLVVVTAGAAASRGYGDVVVYSETMGETRLHNGFRYFGHTLRIISAHGTGTPAAGIYEIDVGAEITNAMSTVDTQGTSQYILDGWAMAGNEPAAGSGNSMVMTITNDAVLTWAWATNYWLNPLAAPHGTTAPSPGWYANGATVEVSAVADEYHHFTNWTGAVSSSDNPVTVVMNGAKQLTANFVADLTANTKTPLWWLAQHGITNDFEAASEADPDGDLIRTADEWIMNTDPNDGTSFLHLGAAQFGASMDVLSWAASSGRVYAVEAVSALEGGGWHSVTGLSSIVTSGTSITITNAASADATRAYRLRVRLP